MKTYAKKLLVNVMPLPLCRRFLIFVEKSIKRRVDACVPKFSKTFGYVVNRGCANRKKGSETEKARLRLTGNVKNLKCNRALAVRELRYYMQHRMTEEGFGKVRSWRRVHAKEEKIVFV